MLLHHSFHVSGPSMAENTMPVTATHLKADDFASSLESGQFSLGHWRKLSNLGNFCMV